MAYNSSYDVGDMKEVVIDGIVITGITFIDFIEIFLILFVLGLLVWQGKKIASVVKK